MYKVEKDDEVVGKEEGNDMADSNPQPCDLMACMQLSLLGPGAPSDPSTEIEREDVLGFTLEFLFNMVLSLAQNFITK